MAETPVDALVLTARFDEQSLDASAQAQLAAVRRFVTTIGELGQTVPAFRLAVDTTQLTTAQQAIADLTTGIREAAGQPIPVAIDIAPLSQSAQQAVQQLSALRDTAAQLLTGLPPLAVDTAAAQAEIVSLLAEIESVRVNLASAGSAGLTLNVSQATTQIGALEAELATLVEQLSGQIELNLDLGPLRASLEQGTAQLDAFRATAEQALAGLPPFQIDTATAQADVRSLIDTIDRLRNQLAEAGSAGLRIDTEQAVAQITRIGDLIRDIPAFRITADASQVVSAQQTIADLSATVAGAARAGIPVTLDLTLLRASVADGIALLASLRAGAVRSLAAIPGLKIDTTVAQAALASVGASLALLREQLSQRTVVQVDIGQAQTEITRIQALLGELPVLRVTADTTQLLAAQEVLDRFLGTASKQGAVLAPLTWDISPFNAAVDEVLRRLDQIGQAAQNLGGAENIAAPVIAPVPPEALGSIERLEAQMGRTADATEALAGFFAGLVTEIVRLAGTADTAGGAFDRLGVSERAAGQAVPVGQFAAFAQEIAAAQARLGTLPGTLDRVAAGMGKATASAIAQAEGWARLSAIGRENQAVLSVNTRLLAGLSEAGRAASLTGFARGLEEIRLTGAGARTEIERTAPAFAAHARGAHQAANALSILAAESIGVTGPIGRLAENLLLFSGGFGVVAVVAAGVLALAKAFEFLTTAQREAQEKQDQFVQSLLQEADNAIPATVRATEALTAALNAQRKAREGLSAAKVLQAESDVITVVTDPLAAIIAARVELNRRSVEEEQRGIRAVAQGRRDVISAEITDLTEVLKLHVATTTQQGRALELLKQISSQQGSLVAKQEQQKENARQILVLTEALALREIARATATQETTRGGDQLAAAQQQFTAQEAALRAHHAIEQIITAGALDTELAQNAEFFQSLRALRISAAQAEEQSIRTQLRVAEREQPKSQQEQIDQQTTIQHLNAQLVLRKEILAAQLAAINNEERLSKLVAFQKVGTPDPAQFLPFVLKPKVDATALRIALQGEITAVIKSISDNAQQIDFVKAIASAETLDNVLVGVTMSLRDIGNANITRPIDEATTAAAKLARAMTEVDRAISAAQSIRATIRGVGTDAGDAVGNVLDLGQAVSDLGKDIASGNIFGAISDVVSGIGSVGKLLGFGKSEKERALEQAQQENTAALHTATLAYQSFVGRFQGAGGIAEQQTIIQRVQANPAAAAAIQAGDITALSAALRGMGLTLDQVREIARTFGISLVKDHSLVEGGTDALTKAMQIAAQAVTHFGATIAEQASVLATRDNLGLGPNAGQPQELASLSRTREIELQGLHLDPATEAKIAALDLTTEAGRKAFLAFNQMLFTLAQNGQLTAEQLGEFASVTELLGPLNDAANGIRALSDATNDATAAMINVPAGFKQAALAFEAQIPGLGPNAPKLPTLTPTHFEPQPAFSVTTQAGAPKTTATTATISVGQVLIQIDAAGKNGFQLAQEIKGHLRNLSNADSGDPDAWGQT